MGRVRAAGFRQRDLREAAGQHRRPAQGDRDFVFQGSGRRLGETGNPDRPEGRWQRSVWPVGHSSQHYGTPVSKTGPSPRTAMVRNFRRSGQEPDLSLMSQGEDAYLVLRGVFHVSPPALGGLSIDGKLTFSNNAYLKLIGSMSAVLLDDCGHAPHRDRPEATIVAINQFLETCG